MYVDALLTHQMKKNRKVSVTSSVVERIDRASKSKGQKGLEERKVFGADLVKRTIAKNLGGGEA